MLRLLIYCLCCVRYDIFFNTATSDVRYTRGNYDETNFADADANGICNIDYLSGNACQADKAGQDQYWGHAAYKYGCSRETAIDWNDSYRPVSGIHPRMGKRCSNPKACSVGLCLRKDVNGIVRQGLVVTDISAAAGSDFSVAAIRYSVTCGVRQKATVCAIKRGNLEICAVKKACGGGTNSAPRGTAKKAAIWSATNLGKTMTVGKAKDIWSEIKQLSAVKASLSRLCSLYCGSF